MDRPNDYNPHKACRKVNTDLKLKKKRVGITVCGAATDDKQLRDKKKNDEPVQSTLQTK